MKHGKHISPKEMSEKEMPMSKEEMKKMMERMMKEMMGKMMKK